MVHQYGLHGRPPIFSCSYSRCAMLVLGCAPFVLRASRKWKIGNRGKAAVRLNAHLAALGKLDASPGRSTVVVVGAGFTGIEVAAEMPSKLARAHVADPHVILVDPNTVVGATIGG
jgi:NADPH-dependent 2,4-dienoyl-CoA reductase/sulfur reductase-like enzyme